MEGRIECALDPYLPRNLQNLNCKICLQRDVKLLTLLTHFDPSVETPSTDLFGFGNLVKNPIVIYCLLTKGTWPLLINAGDESAVC